MMFVAKRDRLLARNMHVGVPRRQLNFIESRAKQGNNEHATVNAQARENIRAVMKYLRHLNLQVLFIPAFFVRFFNQGAHLDDGNHRQEADEKIKQRQEKPDRADIRSPIPSGGNISAPSRWNVIAMQAD